MGDTVKVTDAAGNLRKQQDTRVRIRFGGFFPGDERDAAVDWQATGLGQSGKSSGLQESARRSVARLAAHSPE